MQLNLFLLLAVLTLSGGAFAQGSYPPPFPRDGVTKAIDNESVVVWQGLVGVKSHPTAMHEHTMDLVGVFLDDGGRTKTTTPDGTSRESASPTARGGVVFQPKGVIHIEDQLVDGIRAVGIELKQPPRHGVASVSDLPEGFARAGATLRLENDRVAIWEYQWLAGRTVPRHMQDRDVVVVPLQSGAVRFTTSDNASRVAQFTFGEPLFMPRGDAFAEEAAAGSPRAILVELK